MNNIMRKNVLLKNNNLRLIEAINYKDNDYFRTYYSIFKFQIKKFNVWITFKEINCDDCNEEQYNFDKLNAIELFNTIITI